MRIAGRFDALLVAFARVVQPPQFFERLAAMVICRTIGRFLLSHRFKFRDSPFELAGFDELHCQAVADEGVVGVLGEQLFQGFNTWGCQAVRITPLL